MALEIDFLTFATGAGANVESQATYAADPVQQNGYVVGIALPEQVGKVNRQGNFFSAVLAQFIGTVQDANVLDDGNLTGKIAQMWQSLLAGGYFVDGGTANAILVANPVAPAGALTFVAPQAGTRCSIKVADTNTGPSTIDWMGVNTSPVVGPSGSALAGGEMIAGRIVDFAYDGIDWQIVSQEGNVVSGTPSGSLVNVRIITSSGTYAPTAGTNSVVVLVQGGGGAGGGAPDPGAGNYVASGGGGAGGRAMSRLTSGFSGQTITIGGGGTGVSGGAGNSGGTTSFGSSLSATGGGGSAAANIVSATGISPVGIAGVGSGGNLYNGQGDAGLVGAGTNTANYLSGAGGGSYFGGGGSPLNGVPSAGDNAVSYGAGGGGAALINSAAAVAGGNGAEGAVIVWEFS